MNDKPVSEERNWIGTDNVHRFSPLVSIHQWNKTKKLTKWVLTANNLVSSVEEGDFTIRVLPRGYNVKLHASCTVQFKDMESLHRKWLLDLALEHEMYYPKLWDFCENLKKHWTKPSVWIKLSAMLSFSSQAQMHKSEECNICGRESATWVVYLRLTEVEESYAAQKRTYELK